MDGPGEVKQRLEKEERWRGDGEKKSIRARDCSRVKGKNLLQRSPTRRRRTYEVTVIWRIYHIDETTTMGVLDQETPGLDETTNSTASTASAAPAAPASIDCLKNTPQQDPLYLDYHLDQNIITQVFLFLEPVRPSLAPDVRSTTYFLRSTYSHGGAAAKHGE